MNTTNKLIIRMSGCGDCPRALSAELLGYVPEEKPSWLATTAEEGHWHEERIKSKLQSEGYLVNDAQLELKLEYPTFILLGHIDGSVSRKDNPQKMLLEIKSMSQFEFNRWMKGKFDEFPHYAYQVSCYMTAFGVTETLYVVKNRNSGYEDRMILTQPPIPMTQIIERLNMVVDAVIAKKLAECTFDPYSIECKRCSFKYLCVPPAAAPSQVEEEMLDKAVELYRFCKKQEAEIEEYMDTTKKIFQMYLDFNKLSQYRYKDMILSTIKCKESITYPKANLLKVFTPEQLSLAAEIKPEHSYLRIVDLAENTNGDA